LFIEYFYGKKAANEYVIGLRKRIQNDTPLIGNYGVNNEGSGDMYNKGANLIHSIREVINNDSIFRSILRGLNSEFYHKTVTTKEVEDYISKKSGIDFSKIFDQYLRTTKIPLLEYKMKERKLSYRWTNCVDGFNMPLRIASGKNISLSPSTAWKEMELPLNAELADISSNYYIKTIKIK
jgi:hypothetical protein